LKIRFGTKRLLVASVGAIPNLKAKKTDLITGVVTVGNISTFLQILRLKEIK